MSAYAQKLNATKQTYPFDRWELRGNELEQYSPENCARAAEVFDQLIADLAELGEAADEPLKMNAFRRAIEALNDLNQENYGMLIESEEAEALCMLCNQIAIAAGLNPARYGNGEGPASEWRDW